MLCKMHQALTTVQESPKSTGVYQYYQLDPLSIMKLLTERGHDLPSHEGSDIDDFYTLINQHSIETSELPMTIIHGDWNPWNQLYTENCEVNCVMDFDSLQLGERVFDLAYALYFFSNTATKRIFGKRVSGWLWLFNTTRNNSSSHSDR